MNFYLIHAADDTTLVVRRYMNQGPFTPAEGQLITHNTVPLAKVSGVVDIGDNTWTLTVDRMLPYILIGTILAIGRP